MRTRQTTSLGPSWVGKIYCWDGVLVVTVLGTDATVAETGRVYVVVGGVAVPAEVAELHLITEVNCVIGNGLGRR